MVARLRQLGEIHRSSLGDLRADRDRESRISQPFANHQRDLLGHQERQGVLTETAPGAWQLPGPCPRGLGSDEAGPGPLTGAWSSAPGPVADLRQVLSVVAGVRA